jgi:hypothetical protein
MLNAFRKLKRYINDVFILVNDDALDILLDVKMNNFVGSTLNKQATTANAMAEEFDAFLSLSELFHCRNCFLYIVIMLTPALDDCQTIASNLVCYKYAISHVASPA